MRALGFSDALEPKRRGGGKKHAAELGCRAQANTVRVQNLSVTNDAHLLLFLAAVLAEQVCARMSAELRRKEPKAKCDGDSRGRGFPPYSHHYMSYR